MEVAAPAIYSTLQRSLGKPANFVLLVVMPPVQDTHNTTHTVFLQAIQHAADVHEKHEQGIQETLALSHMLSAPPRNSSRAASTARTVPLGVVPVGGVAPGPGADAELGDGDAGLAQPHLALALLDRRRRAGRHRAGRAAARPPPAAAGERRRAAAGHAAGNLQGHRALARCSIRPLAH